MFSLVIALSLFFVAIAVVVAEYVVIGWMRMKNEPGTGDAAGSREGIGKLFHTGWRITDEVNPFIAVDASA